MEWTAFLALRTDGVCFAFAVRFSNVLVRRVLDGFRLCLRRGTDMSYVVPRDGNGFGELRNYGITRTVSALVAYFPPPICILCFWCVSVLDHGQILKNKEPNQSNAVRSHAILSLQVARPPYLNVRPPVLGRKTFFLIFAPANRGRRFITLFVHLFLFYYRLPTGQNVCRNNSPIDRRFIIQIVAVVVRRFCFRTRVEAICGSNRVGSRYAGCAIARRNS